MIFDNVVRVVQEIVEYLVRVDLDKLGIDDLQFEEMKVIK